MLQYPELYKNLTNLISENLSKQIIKPIILDIGCGPGLLLIEIQRKIPKTTIIGLDPSLLMLDLAKKQGFKQKSKNFNVILSTAEKVPLKSNSVDILVSRFSLPYWKSADEGFKEIYRVIKPNGKVILEALNFNFPRWKLFLIKCHMFINSAGKDIIKYHIDSYKKAYTNDKIIKYLTENKFKIHKQIGSKKEWKFIIIAKK
jgi:ubiquinone/menaquinone biosynthesis C-methylase UbiE